MKKLLVVILILAMAASVAFAQEEINTKKLDWGARFGTPLGFSARYFMSESNCIEAMIGISHSNLINITGLYEWKKPLVIGEFEGLSWYFGGGAHLGLIGVSRDGGWTFSPNFNIGIDGVVGAEYDLYPMLSFPMSVSLEWKPAINLFGAVAWDMADFAATVHFNFKKR